MITLRDYQEAAIQAARDDFARGRKRTLIVAPTGSGKAILSGKIAALAAPKGRVLVLCSQSHLIKQNLEKFRAFSDIDAGIYCNSLNRKDTTNRVIFASRDSLGRNPEACGIFECVVLDEAHQLDIRENSMYMRIMDVQKSAYVVGMTGTPWRLSGGRIWGDGKFFQGICYNIGMDVLRKQGFLVPYTFPLVNTKIDTDGIKTQNGDFNLKELEERTSNDSIIKGSVREWLTYEKLRRCTMFFCVTRNHGQKLCNALYDYLTEDEVVYVDGETENRDQILDEIRQGKYKAVVSIGALTTGFDAPIVDCIVMLRATKSTSLFVQCLDLQTEILTTRGWLSENEVSEDDICLSFDMETGFVVKAPIIEKIIRKSLSDESFVEINTNRQNFRVTDGHRMIMRIDKSKSWQFRVAKKCSELRDGWYVPVSCHSTKPDVALSDDEIRFIGWVVSDGCVNKNNINISQAKPKYVEEIRLLIKRLGYRFGEYRKNNKSNFKRNFTVSVFSVSYANPRKLSERHLTGCEKIRKYLSKSLPFEDLSERQFDILMDSIIKADAGVYENPIDGRGNKFEQKSFRILKSIAFIEKLQTLCIVNGWRADIVQYKKDGKKTDRENATTAMISITKTNSKIIGGSGQNDRKSAKITAPTEEMVWCVENTVGTLITRRNGKVTIMGNCVGRGIRPYPGKENLLILDFAQNFTRFGTLEMPKVTDMGALRESSSKNENVEKKECPACKMEISIFARECGFCGEIFKINHSSKAHRVGDKAAINRCKVLGVSVEPHIKKDTQERGFKVVWRVIVDKRMRVLSEYFMVHRNASIKRLYENRLAQINAKPVFITCQVDGVFIKPIDIETEHLALTR